MDAARPAKSSVPAELQQFLAGGLLAHLSRPGPGVRATRRLIAPALNPFC